MKNKLLEELKIDPEKEEKRIKEFILKEKERLGKDGAVIGLSGGLDSSVCAFLLKDCFGDKVLGLILPERDSNPKNTEDARELARELKIETKEIDLTPFFERIGVYKLFDKRFSQNRKLVETLIKGLQKTLNQPSLFAFGFPALFGQKSLGQKIISGHINKTVALATVKTRLRMVFLHYLAALNNYFVCGTTDKTEWSVGFYDGDAICHIQLLLHLFKTQIRQLAFYLGLPKNIIEKPSSGDLFGKGLPNEIIIGLSYETLDSIFYGLEKECPKKEIQELVGVNDKEIEAVCKLVEIDKIRKSLPSSL